MNRTAAVFLGVTLPCIALSVGAQDKKWVCDAKNLVVGSYNGGDQATIQLRAYSRAGTYSVKKNAAGDTATGVTADGTAFTCTLK